MIQTQWIYRGVRALFFFSIFLVNTALVQTGAWAAANNADLGAISLTVGTVAPPVSGNTPNYFATVLPTTSTINITATTADSSASIRINSGGFAVSSATGSIGLNFGQNTVTISVKSQDGTVQKSYTLTVTRPFSTDANLSALALSAGSLNPAFASGTVSYTASVPSTTASITVTPTVEDATASVQVNNVAVASGTASGSISLNVGQNTITTVVTAQDGATTKTYTIVVTRAAASNIAELSGLALSAGALTPTFSSGTFSYTASVPNAASSIVVTPAASDANATIKVNGVTVASGTASGGIALGVGQNTITTMVTAQDGATVKSYTVVVTRPPSSNADLSALVPGTGTLSPGFASGTVSYSMNVPNAVAALTLTPTRAEGNATIKINNLTVASGTASGNIALNVGQNTITTVVTAQDGTTIKTYVIVVTRAASSNADLADLVPGSGTLSPGFASGTTGYTINVPNTTTAITITPTRSEVNATIKVNNVTVTSGTASGSIALNVGNNTITTVVTAQDGTTTKTYVITVSRAAAVNDAGLSALVFSSGALAPDFFTDTTSYSVTVANAVSSITVTPTASGANATIKVNNTSVASGAASGSIALGVGQNTITTVVTAQDGITARSYTITVTRAASNSAELSALNPSVGTLAPSFSSSTTTYMATVPNATTTVDVTATAADPNARVRINSQPDTVATAFSTVGLLSAQTTITITVTAQDTTTIKTYTLTIARQPSINADLAGLVLSTGTVNPVFASATTNYTAAVSNTTAAITVTPMVADSTAAVSVNNSSVISGQASGSISLSVGTNLITTVVTAQDASTTKTYTVAVIRASASLNIGAAAQTQTFDVTWPAVGPETYQLQESPALGVTADWQPVNLTPAVANGTNRVSVSISGNSRFYRLILTR